jgi:predicted nucleic acid-binding protein
VTPARWLIDKSALAQLSQPTVAHAAWARIAQGTVAVSIVTELEMDYSARSATDYLETRTKLVDRLLPVYIPLRAETRAREVQAALVRRGLHRSAGVADLLIAATAEIEDLTVLHYDADFEVIADITGQLCEWVVARGTI